MLYFCVVVQFSRNGEFLFRRNPFAPLFSGSLAVPVFCGARVLYHFPLPLSIPFFTFFHFFRFFLTAVFVMATPSNYIYEVQFALDSLVFIKYNIMKIFHLKSFL